MKKPTTKKTSAKKTEKPFDKEAWLADKLAKVDNAKERLEAGLLAFQTGEEWKTMLKALASNVRRRLSFTRYSFSNQILVWLACPIATSVAGFHTWKRFGRSVKKGERGIVILAPRPWKKEIKHTDGTTEEKRGLSFGTEVVFDITQTEGKDLPAVSDFIVPVQDVSGFEHTVETLREVALSIEGSPVSAIELRTRSVFDPVGAAGWYAPRTKEIVIMQEGSRAAQFAVLVHEVAHALLHPAGDHHSTPEREVEAESVSFVVCEVLGLDTSKAAFPYVATWSQRSQANSAAEMVKRSGDRITKAVHVILDALLGKIDDSAPEETSEHAA